MGPGTVQIQDYERAVEWFRKAAAKDHSYGLVNLEVRPTSMDKGLIQTI